MGLSVFPVAASGFNQTTMTLRHSITSTGTITIPTNITQVFAVVIGGGGSGMAGNSGGRTSPGGGGGAGGVSYGWVAPSNSAVIGAGGVGSAGSNGTNGNPSTYAGIIAGGGAAGGTSSPRPAPITFMGASPYFVGNVTVDTLGAVHARNGSCGGCGPADGTGSTASGFFNTIYLNATSVATPYESIIPTINAPMGAVAFPAVGGNTGTNGITNGVSGSGGTIESASILTPANGNGGYGYYAAGGGCGGGGVGGNTNFFNGGTSTRAVGIGGGGGAGALAAGVNATGINGGAGGAGGGGGGGGAGGSGSGTTTGGNGGSGAVLIFY